MTKNVPEVALLQTTASQQVQPDEINLIEAKEQTIAAQITLKGGDSFLVTDVCGDLLSSRQEMGLFRHGTRFLRTCNLFLEGQSLVTLSHQTSRMSNECHIDLTNMPLQIGPNMVIEQGIIHIDRFLELEQDYLLQTFTLTSFYTQTLPVTLSLKIGADFCDLFEVRGFERKQHGTLQPARQNDQGIELSYRGLDKVERCTQFLVEPPTEYIQDNRIDWALQLRRGEPVEIRVKIQMSESGTDILKTRQAATLWNQEASQPRVVTDNPFFNRLIDRGMNDLMMLSTMTPYGFYPYAGIPWFNCPFGRDGLITALEFLPFYPQVAHGVLQFLAAYQGTKVEPFTDEEPGKILHEFRTGEMANCREIPYIPYYGTVDATPLFLITLDAYIRWTNDRTLLEQLWPNAQAAARWMVEYGDRDGDTFLEYGTASEKGLANQGWKDSWDGVSHSDGRVAAKPMALSEVQGYAYAAYRAISGLARLLGETNEAAHWDQQAEILQENFLEHYWWEDEHVVYQGLAQHKEPCDVVSSNAGQCLWTGILPDDKAQLVIERLLRKDMFSGWGVRTLSTQAALYNPLSYHNGSVWPHDTALIGVGCALYGGKQEAGQLLKSLFDASHHFENARLPELYCGFERREGYGPTRYPVSCSPQAWATGAPHMILMAMLGLNPNAKEQHLTLHQPTLPDWLNTLEIDELYIGKLRVHLRFERHGTHTEVIPGHYNQIDLNIIR
jgi:glycogen debranching enzyme